MDMFSSTPNNCKLRGMEKDGETLSQVVGRNARELRGEFTLENVASTARKFGAKWSSGSVSTIELGRSKCTIETLAILALALDELRVESPTDERVGKITINDLLRTNKRILITPELKASSDSLQEFLGGETSYSVLDLPGRVEDITGWLEDFTDTLKGLNLPNQSAQLYVNAMQVGDFTPTEERLAKKLGIHLYELRWWSYFLWKTSIEHRRDELSGNGATPQKKGRITRELLNEISEAMENNNGVD